MTRNEIEMYVPNLKKFIFYFGEDVTYRVASRFPLSTFSKKEYVREGSLYWATKGYPLVERHVQHSFPEDVTVVRTKKRGVADIPDWADVYLIPSDLNEGKLIQACIEEVWPFMATFELKCYHLDRKDNTDEVYVYVKTDAGEKVAMYLPLKALMEMDFSIAEERQTSYYTGYCRRPEQKEYLEKQLGVLQHPEILRLKQRMDEKVREVTPGDLAAVEAHVAAKKAELEEKRRNNFIRLSTKRLVLSYLSSIESYTGSCAGGDEVAEILPQLKAAIEAMQEEKAG